MKIYFSCASRAQFFNGSCTGFPQGGGRVSICGKLSGVLVLAASLLVIVGAGAFAQSLEALTSFRVFLKDGRAIPSYGEYALLGDRIVFVLPIGAPPASELQLISLPVTAIDMERTAKYAEGVRARTYAETRGPAEYSALTVEVSEILTSIEREPDAKRRLALAEEARNRLRAWPNAHYGFRAAEIRELIAMFDDVIADMHRSSGPGDFSVELVAGPVVPTYEPALPPPTARESLDLALAAAASVDRSGERQTILRRALAAAEARSDAEDLRVEIARRLGQEAAADEAYARLGQGLLERADRALRRADVVLLASLRPALTEGDRALGSMRPAVVLDLSTRLDAALERARAYRLALDHWAAVRGGLLRYERRIRPVLSGLDGLNPVLVSIQGQSGPEFDRLEGARARIETYARDLQRIQAPEDLQIVHATLLSALFVAREACERRRQAVIGRNSAKAGDAAAAAAGALLLADQARRDLVSQLSRPTLR